MNEKTESGVVKDLLSKRSDFMGIKSKIVEIIEPKIFQLHLENISNVRNTIVIAGALLTVCLVIVNNIPQNFPDNSVKLLQVSILGFLFSILFYSFYLK